MTGLPHVDSFDPEDKDGVIPQSTGENGAGTDTAHEEASLTAQVELNIGDPHFMVSAYDTYADLQTKGPYPVSAFPVAKRRLRATVRRSSVRSSGAKPSSSPATTK